jgi:hypothetical protein
VRHDIPTPDVLRIRDHNELLYFGTRVCLSKFPTLYPESVAHTNNNVEGLSKMR